MPRIVHLSDLHFGSEPLRNPLARELVEPFSKRILSEIKSLKTDLIIVSGDFIDASPPAKRKGSLSSPASDDAEWIAERFDRARMFLTSLAELVCSTAADRGDPPYYPECTRLLLIPGNHDATRDSADPLSNFASQIGKYFAAPEIFIAPEHLDEHRTFSPGGFRDGSCYVFPSLDLLIYLFSSANYLARMNDLYVRIESHLNALTSLSTRDEEKIKTTALLKEVKRRFLDDVPAVGNNTLAELEASLKNVARLCGSSFSRLAKIAVVHHNPAHTPDVDVGMYSDFISAGKLKSALCKHRFDLVLHGHKHQSFACYEFNSGQKSDWGLHSLGAHNCDIDTGRDAAFFEINLSKRHFVVHEHRHIGGGTFRQSRFWEFTGGRSGRPKIPVVCWPGYQASSSLEVASTSGVRFVEHCGIRGELQSLRLELDTASIVIDDHDLLEHLSSQIEKQPGSLIRDLNNAHVSRCLWRAVDPNYLLPLRCGLNAIGILAAPGEEALRSEELRAAVGGALSYRNLIIISPGADKVGVRLGAWDHPFICIPLLLSALLGEKLETVHSVKYSTLQELVKWVTAHSDEIRKIRLYSTIDGLATGLFSQASTAIIGGGGWLKPALNKYRERALTVVPPEGALLWVECAAILKKWSSTQKDSLREFLACLLSPDAQEEIADSREYTACPVIPIEDRWVRDVNDAQKIFSRPDCEGLRNTVYPRRYPARPVEWEEAWERIKEVISET